MVSFRILVAATSLFLSTANAHFLLLNPLSIEGTDIDEDKEGNAPCGADTPDLSKPTSTSFHVGGDFVSLQLGHPQAQYIIRATFDDKASGNWTQLFPIVQQSGLGKFCEPVVTAPESWVGKTGIIGVACDAPDGILYQCSVVNFVAGTNTGSSSACSNASSVTGSFVSDSKLSALVNPSNSSSTTPSSSSSTTPSASKTASPTGNAAATLASGGYPFGSLLAAAAMVFAGTALL